MTTEKILQERKFNNIRFNQNDSIDFAKEFDPNPIHLKENSYNPFIKKRCVSGIYVQSVINKILLHSDIYEGLVCATNVSVKFIRPVIPESPLLLVCHYEDYSHRKSRKYIFRKIKCILKEEISNMILVEYKVTNIIGC
ncbi:MaoC/PaaZ C-terminal domain-containing protein [Xenorhabdus thuongxuanensis]|uniref:Uncharacterized protein n=1 Tax=Xenorhabdus thuongxuanensis TaxID=1873484 RepID=A0A1Q5U170_9GAMM|nr:MaoC/PaaZ C-terminal domain-containing protein [Xenorhabdus thuongxuanensis]OKP06226.1 hypothetical protein Xentx_02196 [Xenorhabdus thuongxuanensis]